MKYTTNYNLYKPDYDDTIDVDFLNKNMDVLDTQLNGLDYLQNVNTSDNGLTFIKRNGDTIPVSLNYLPISGGNLTGDLTVQDKTVVTLLDYQTSTLQEGKVEMFKYSDGTMLHIGKCRTNYDAVYTITFLSPYKERPYATATGWNESDDSALEVADIVGADTTRIIFATGSTADNIGSHPFDFHIMGRWK